MPLFPPTYRLLYRLPDMKHIGSADPEASLCFGRLHCNSHSQIAPFDPEKLPLSLIPVP